MEGRKNLKGDFSPLITGLYFCVQDVEKCDFECVQDRYQCCVIFALPVFQTVCVLVVFDSPVASPAHGLLGLCPIPRL